MFLIGLELDHISRVGLLNVLRAAGETLLGALRIEAEAELGGDHHLIVNRSESFAHKFFVGERAVTFAVSKKETPRSRADRISEIASYLSGAGP